MVSRLFFFHLFRDICVVCCVVQKENTCSVCFICVRCRIEVVYFHIKFVLSYCIPKKFEYDIFETSHNIRCPYLKIKFELFWIK